MAIFDITYVGDMPYLKTTGGIVTGPTTFGSSVTIDEATVGDLIVTGNISATNNIQANTINGVTVGSSPKFTDTITSYSVATTSANGLMAAADKVAVNKIGSGTLNTTNKTIIPAINELKTLISEGPTNEYIVSNLSFSTTDCTNGGQTGSFTTSINPTNNGFLVLPVISSPTSSTGYNVYTPTMLVGWNLGGSNSVTFGYGAASNYDAYGMLISGSSYPMNYTYASNTVTLQKTNGMYGAVGNLSYISYKAYIPSLYPVRQITRTYPTTQISSCEFTVERRPKAFAILLTDGNFNNAGGQANNSAGYKFAIYDGTTALNYFVYKKDSYVYCIGSSNGNGSYPPKSLAWSYIPSTNTLRIDETLDFYTYSGSSSTHGGAITLVYI